MVVWVATEEWLETDRSKGNPFLGLTTRWSGRPNTNNDNNNNNNNNKNKVEQQVATINNNSNLKQQQITPTSATTKKPTPMPTPASPALRDLHASFWESRHTDGNKIKCEIQHPVT